ncbi:MAG: alpha-glucosidase C-terminal domain-containing protein [Methylotenera sp.]
MEVENPHLFVFARFDHLNTHSRVLVVANFDHQPQALHVEALRKKGYFAHPMVKDLHTGDTIEIADMQLTVPARGFFWLQT